MDTIELEREVFEAIIARMEFLHNIVSAFLRSCAIAIFQNG